MSSFSALISRDVFQSGNLSDLTRVDLEAYFISVKTRYESGEEYPYSLDELIPVVFTRKDMAVEALVRDFTQDIDFARSVSRRNENNPNPPIEYHLSPLAFEFMVARKHKEIFALYHTVFHMRTGSKSEQPQPTAPVYALEDGMRLLAKAKTFAADVLGLVGNQALLSANQATYKALGVDVLDHFDQKALPADKRGKTFTQTELGKCFFNLPINARQMGILLNVAGLQNRVDDHWEPTEKAAGLYEWLDTGKWHHSGTPVKQLKWFKQVIDHPDFVTALLPRNTINKRINPLLPDQSPD